MVYGSNPLVHHSNCLYNPINSKNIHRDNTTDKREIERRVLERYSIEKAIGREGLIARREESQETD
jgi:hypothetical protein